VKDLEVPAEAFACDPEIDFEGEIAPPEEGLDVPEAPKLVETVPDFDIDPTLDGALDTEDDVEDPGEGAGPVGVKMNE